MKGNRHFTAQFTCILFLLGCIMLQGFTKMVNMKPLGGHVKAEKPVELSFKTYYDGSYQAFLTEHAKRNTGFREFFIRNYNQVLYSCFHKINNNTLTEGKDREIFLNMYLEEITGEMIKARYGTVEEAKRQAQHNVEETLRLIDTLEQHGTKFLFVFAPTKTAVYPEKMPQYYQDRIADFCLEEYYIDLFKENNIPHIDFYHYFQDIRDTVSWPLYTRTASHWAESILPYVADSLLRKLEAVTGYPMPSVELLDLNVTDQYSDYDREFEKSMNMLFPWPKPDVPRPFYTLTPSPSLDGTVKGGDRPNLLVTGDSYFDQLMFSCFKDAFNHWDFWQYNLNVYSSRGYWKEPFENIRDLPVTLSEADILLAIYTAPMLYDFMFDFPNKAFNMYDLTETEIAKVSEEIRRDKPWFEAVVKQAENKGITVEENLRINAIYVINARKDKNKSENP